MAGLNVDVSKKAETAAFQIADESKGNVTITLEEGSSNILKGGAGTAALQKNGGEESGRLTIEGNGALEAVAAGFAPAMEFATGLGAGIGSALDDDGNICDCSHITIFGGKIIAIGGGVTIEKYGRSGIGGAGIGGGGYSKAIDINIIGGDVKAFGGSGSLETSSGNGGAAGIGGGGWADCYDITISGGIVEAISAGDGPGIGGHDSSVLITGGNVTATSEEGSGIGGCGAIHGETDVTITGGVVNAKSNSRGTGTGIGAPDSAVIHISGGTVTASAADNVGIGASFGNTGAGSVEVTITGGIIAAAGGNGSAGIGCGPSDCSDYLNLTIDGHCIVMANGSQSESCAVGAAIGGGVTTSHSDNEPDQDGVEADSNTWHGIVFKNNVGAIYGDSVRLTQNFTLPEGSTLTIGEGQTLTIGEGVTLDTSQGTLVNNGSIYISQRSTVGPVTGNQPVYW